MERRIKGEDYSCKKWNSFAGILKESIEGIVIQIMQGVENMNRKITGLVLILMICFTNTVLAANWVYVATSWFGQDKMYVDTESVYKTNDTIIFWELLIEDDTPDKANKTLYKYEAKITSERQRRILEYLLYNPQGKETFRNRKSGAFSPVQKNSPADQCIDFAIKHVRAGKDTGAVPALPPKN